MGATPRAFAGQLFDRNGDGAVGKRRMAREMAVQMLYQADLAGSSVPEVTRAFDLADFLRTELFIRSFDACEDKARAFGSNFIGALVGGLLDSLSFVTGLRALVVLVGLFYGAAVWLRRTKASKEAATR